MWSGVSTCQAWEGAGAGRQRLRKFHSVGVSWGVQCVFHVLREVLVAVLLRVVMGNQPPRTHSGRLQAPCLLACMLCGAVVGGSLHLGVTLAWVACLGLGGSAVGT